MELAKIPLGQLEISPHNMRHGRKAPDVSDILPSIRARGIQQPLLVRKKGKAFEIIAGRRRFFSLKKIAQKNKKAEPVPCAIMDEGDDAEAIEASLIENLARLDPDEMTRYESFSRLVKEGKKPEDIAATFCVTEIMVRRSLALGNLIPEIRNAYRNEEIDARTIRQLTIANKSQQADWFKLFKDPDQRTPQAWQLKQWLFGGEIKTSCALFPLETYKGKITTDLFEEYSYFNDTNAFWKLQNEAIAARRDAYIKAGFDDVVICDVGRQFCNWDYVKTPKKDGGRVYLEIAENGDVTFHEGLITQKEHHARIRKTASAKGSELAQDTRPELTKAAQNYMNLHRHAAIRTALLKEPKIALRLMVTHAIVGSTNWRTGADPQRADKDMIAESIAKSVSQTVFETEKKEILKLLDLPAHHHSVTHSNADPERAAHIFQTLLEHDDKTILRILTFIMAETLQSGAPLIEMLGGKLSIDMRKCWQPDDAFFALLRDKAAINAMLKHIGGKHVADSNVSATAKVQKQIINDFVTGNGRKKAQNWLPHYMAFPFKAYTKAGAGDLSTAADQAKLFTK